MSHSVWERCHLELLIPSDSAAITVITLQQRVSDMTISASVGTSSAGASVASLFSPVGLSAGSVFVAIVLIFTLGYLDLLSASERDRSGFRQTLIAISVPLGITFAGIVLYQSLTVLRFV